MKKLLVVDIENKVLEVLVQVFERSGVDVAKAIDAHQAARILMRENIDVVLLDTVAPTLDGRIISRIAHTHNPDCKVIISSEFPRDFQRESIPDAYDYHEKSEGAKALFDKVLAVV